jgi:hypothetical protein
MEKLMTPRLFSPVNGVLEWTVPEKGCGPFTAFYSLKDALRWQAGFSRWTFMDWEIWDCDAILSKENRVWHSHHSLFPFSALLGTALEDLAPGTVLVDRFTLRRKIKL